MEIDQDELLASMTTEAELSGALNMALQGLARFISRGRRYDIPVSVQDSLDEFRATTDPLAVWLNRVLVIDAEAVVVKSDLLRAYNDAAKAEGFKGMNETSLGIALRRQRPELFNEATSTQKTVAGKIEHVWIGVGLIDKARRHRE